MPDYRSEAADYYDLAPHKPNDVPFYIEHLPRADAAVLELGCGTGRVTLPLSAHCAFIQGVDHSEAMIEICESKLAAADIAPARAMVRHADFTTCSLERRFDYIIAPFRVLQNVVSDADVEALFRMIAEHLEPDGLAILNVFRPNRGPDKLVEQWGEGGEERMWEVMDGEDKVVCSVRRSGFNTKPLVLYPDSIYRRSRSGNLLDEAVLSVPMRCYYPTEFTALIERRGFEVVEQWGGYGGEPYGEGTELIVAMRPESRS